MEAESCPASVFDQFCLSFHPARTPPCPTIRGAVRSICDSRSKLFRGCQYTHSSYLRDGAVHNGGHREGRQGAAVFFQRHHKASVLARECRHPELVVSGTRDTKAVLDANPADACISANRTCEMGLLHATGRPYQSFVFLLEELSRPERPKS